MNKKVCMELKNIRRSYGKKEHEFDVLSDVNFTSVTLTEALFTPEAQPTIPPTSPSPSM